MESGQEVKLTTQVDIERDQLLLQGVVVGKKIYSLHLIQSIGGVVIVFDSTCRIAIDHQGTATFQKQVEGHWDHLQVAEGGKSFVYHPEYPYQ